MKTFRYWYIRCEKDAEAFSIIATKKEDALKQYDEYYNENLDDDPCREFYAKEVEHREVTFLSMQDFFEYATGETGGRGCGYKLKAYPIRRS